MQVEKMHRSFGPEAWPQALVPLRAQKLLLSPGCNATITDCLSQLTSLT